MFKSRVGLGCVAVLRMSAGSWFHACGAAVEKTLEPNTVRDRCLSKKTVLRWT